MRIDGDPGGTVAQASDDEDVATFLGRGRAGRLPRPGEGIGLLAGPSLLPRHSASRAHTLVLVGLPARAAREAAVVSVEHAVAARSPPCGPRFDHALALERLDLGEIMVERSGDGSG